MPRGKTLEENMKQIQEKLDQLATAQDTQQRGAISRTFANIKNRFRRYKDAKEKKELDKRLTEMLKKNQSPKAKKKILDLISILRKTPTPTPPPGTPPGTPTPESSSASSSASSSGSITPTPESSSASSSGSATPQEDQPLLQKEEKKEKRGPGRPRKSRNPVGRPSNVQLMTKAEQQDKNIKSVIDKVTEGKLPEELIEKIQEIYSFNPNPVERAQQDIEKRRERMAETKRKNKEEIERKQQEEKEKRQQQEKEQKELQKQQEEAQLIETVRASTQLTDNVNKAEEQGSNTEIITPDYLSAGQQRPILIESKYDVPPPNLRPQVNELMNDKVETVPDAININPNQPGRIEAEARDYLFRPNFILNESSYFDKKKQREELEKAFRESDEREAIAFEELNHARATNALHNPLSSSSNPDNSNYENTTEDKRNQLLEEAQGLEFSDDAINNITNLTPEGVENTYNEFLGRQPSGRQPTGRQPTLEQQLRERAGNIARSRRGSEESQLGQRLGQIGAGAQAGAIAGARQGMQRGGLRGALEGGAEGGLRGGVAAGIAGQLGGGLVGQVAQMGAQAGISDILGRIRRLGAGDDQPDGGVDIKTQIDNINQELSAIKDPLKYPEFKEKEIYRFPGPDEQKKGVQLVQNGITEYLNDVNLYGGGYEYQEILDL